MSELSKYLRLHLWPAQVEALLALYPENGAINFLKTHVSDADQFDVLSAALSSRAKPITPKTNLNHGGIHAAIKGE